MSDSADGHGTVPSAPRSCRGPPGRPVPGPQADILQPGCPAGLGAEGVAPTQVYIEDSLGERIWVDSPHCKTFVDNIQTAFNTRMPPRSVLLQGEAGRGAGDLGAGERHCRLGRAGVQPQGRGGLGVQAGGRRCMEPSPWSAGSSPHPSLTEEEDSQTELLIAEEKLSPEQEGQLMPR